MFGTVKKIMAAGTVLALSTAAAQALAVKFDQPNMGFGKGSIVVESTDGKTWSKIKSANLEMPYAMFVGHNSNDYDFIGHSVLQDGNLIFQSAEWTAGDAPNPLSLNGVVQGTTDNFNTITKMNLRDACNSRLTKTGAIYEDQKMFFKVPLQLFADFYRDNGTQFRREARGHSMVPVVCKGIGHPQRTKKPLRISKVRFQAYAENTNHCPKQRIVRLKLEGNRTSKVDVVVMRDDGKKIEATVPVSKPGEHHQFFVLESTRVKKTETRKYYLVVKGHKISVGWKDVAINCAVGQDHQVSGELTVDRKPNLDKPRPGTKVTGKAPAKPVILVRPVKPTKPKRPGLNLTAPLLKCIGGKISLAKCYCPKSHKRLKLAKNTYRCVKKVTNKTPKRVKPNRKRRVAAPHKKTRTNAAVLKLFKTVR